MRKRERAVPKANGRPAEPIPVAPLLLPVGDPRRAPAVGFPAKYVAAAGGTVGAYTVDGDCMVPVIQDGDVVLVDYGRAWADGAIVAARVPGRGMLVKRAYREDGLIVLRPDAPGWPEFREPGTIVYGVVIALFRAVT